MSLNRDRFLRATAGTVAGLAAGAGDIDPGLAADQTPIGTFPAGIGKDSVFVGLCCPLTGSYGADGDFSEDKIKERYNADLANGLGNFAARVLTLAEKEALASGGKLDAEFATIIDTICI